MNDMSYTGVTIKSNVRLKSRKLVRPMDNLPDEMFHAPLIDVLTYEQRALRERMFFYAKEVRDINNNLVDDQCFKGCLDCGDLKNSCQRPQNKQLKSI